MSTFIDLLRQHHQALETQYSVKLSHDIRKAIYAMLLCKTAQQRQSLWACDACEYHDRTPLSCGHRNCPQCQQNTTSQWLTRQKEKRLPVDYFMVTFTLPFELRALARRRPKAMFKLMFIVTSSLLKDFAARQGLGNIGFTSVLHTHSRRRELHPHLHIIVPNGGFDAKRKQWRKGKKGYLFNAFALAKVWRARMLDAIKKHPDLSLVNLKKMPTKWVVDCKKVGNGLPALKYLSRYLYRGVLPDKDIIHYDQHNVTFRYQDSTTKKIKHRTLPTLKFLMLILQHVLPKGLQRVRDYGLLSSSAKKVRLIIQLLLLPIHDWLAPTKEITQPRAIRRCPCCRHEMHCIGVTRTP
ncbi:MAG: IS91 family transposase [Gammaproteobacteria bacterium]|nr:MAG: IS91 family transposase [Gammaproteobacteria bacterium]